MKHTGCALGIVAIAIMTLTACAKGTSPGQNHTTPGVHAMEAAATTSMTTTMPQQPGVGESAPADQAPQDDSKSVTATSRLPGSISITTSALNVPQTTESESHAETRSPDEIVADAGPRGQEYLRALRSRGIPSLGMDSVEISFANGTCSALSSGMSRSEVLDEFSGVAEALASGIALKPGDVAEAYVSSAEQTYC